MYAYCDQLRWKMIRETEEFLSNFLNPTEGDPAATEALSPSWPEAPPRRPMPEPRPTARLHWAGSAGIRPSENLA
jgi:hypothetical protein